MGIIKYIIFLLIINAMVFVMLNWSIGFRKHKSIAIPAMILFVILSYLSAKFFEKRYTIPIERSIYLTSRLVEQVDWIKEDSVQHYTMNQSQLIENEQAKKILAQLANNCNQNDTIAAYFYEARTKFNSMKIWVHTNGNVNKIFFVSLAR